MSYHSLYTLRSVVCILAILACFKSKGQDLKILSTKEKTPVSFAVVLIKNHNVLVQQQADVNGVAPIQADYLDTLEYHVKVNAVGYISFLGRKTGKELKNGTTIYLKSDSIHLNEVVVTGQYAPTQADQSVQKVNIIDQEKIKQMGAVNLRDVLTNQLNVRLQQDNILGSGMSLQGISGENVKILMDGVPMIGRQNGNLDLSQINMNNVERIEFMEGPLSVQYGTNALAGTINIITKKTLTKKYTASVAGYYESIGTYNLTGDVTASYKKHSLQVSGGRNYFDGWNPGDQSFSFPKEHIADSTRSKQWKPKEQYFASFAYQYQLKKIALGFKSAYFHEHITNRGFPRAPYGETSFDDHYTTERLDNSFSVIGKISKNWSVNSLSAYNIYNRIKRTVYKDLTNLQETLSGNSSDQDTSKFTLLMTRASFIHAVDSEKLSYELGYDLNYESALGKRIDQNIQYMGDYAGFITVEYKPIPRLVIKPGIRYAYNTIYKTPVIPSLNIKYTLNSKHTFRASYARGFRAPSLKEMYFLFVDINHNIVGNKDLRAEQSDNFSVAYSYKKNINNCRVIFDVNAFYNNIFNMITLAQTNATEYAYINVGKYKSEGVQLKNTLEFKRLTLQTGFNFTGRYNELVASESIPAFNYSPEALANISYRLLKQKATFSVFYKYNGKLPGYALVNDQLVQTSLAGYQIMDATITKLFMNERIAWSIGCKNIFDIRNISSSNASTGVHSTSSTSVPLSTGRNYFMKLTLTLSKL